MKNVFVLFLISPFLGVIQAFKHYKETWAKNSIWLFVVFYGFTMFRPDEMDSHRYVEKLATLYNAPLNWEVFKNNFYSDEGATIDIYEPIVTYTLSLFTNSGNILFAVFGIVFGYFYSRNIWLLLSYAKKTKMNSVMWILIFSFAFMIGFWELNGVRMWTAAHIYFYGAFLLLVNGNKKGYFIAACSILVHFSFAMPVALLAVCYFVKIPSRILYFIFVASFFLSELNISAVGNAMSSLAPEFLLPKIQTYTNDEYVETVSEAAVGNWYVNYYTKAVGWSIFIMISSIYFSSFKLIKVNKSFSNFFSFTLVFLIFGNLMSQIPSGGRYLTIAKLFALALLFLFYILYDDKIYKRRILLVAPLLVFFIIISLRICLDTVTFTTVLTNPIVAVFIDLPVPLISLLK